MLEQLRHALIACLPAGSTANRHRASEQGRRRKGGVRWGISRSMPCALGMRPAMCAAGVDGVIKPSACGVMQPRAVEHMRQLSTACLPTGSTAKRHRASEQGRRRKGGVRWWMSRSMPCAWGMWSAIGAHRMDGVMQPSACGVMHPLAVGTHASGVGCVSPTGSTADRHRASEQGRRRKGGVRWWKSRSMPCAWGMCPAIGVS